MCGVCSGWRVGGGGGGERGGGERGLGSQTPQTDKNARMSLVSTEAVVEALTELTLSLNTC